MMGCQMTSSNWSEVEKLSRDIADTETWLAQAEAAENFDLAMTLQRQIAVMEERRHELLGDIAGAVLEQQRPAASKEISINGESSQATAPSRLGDPGSNERIRNHMWRLTPADVDRAREEVERQRTELLARHAEEIQSLEAEVAEVDNLQQGIELFVRKFGTNAAALISPSQTGEPFVLPTSA